MPWNGSGVFTRLYSWVSDRDNGINITASRVDADEDDIAAGLMNCLTVDGQTLPTTNLPMRGYRHTGAGNAISPNDYVTLGQLNSGNTIALSAGSLNVSGDGTISGTSHLNQVNANGITTGALSVTNTIGSSGSNAGLEFAARDAPGTNWIWYATGGAARLWMNGDKMWCDTGGNSTVTGNFAVNGPNLWCTNVWATGTVQGSYLHSTGNVNADNALTVGSLQLYNSGGWLYTNASFNAGDIYSRGNLNAPNGWVSCGQSVTGNYLHSTGNVQADGALGVNGGATINGYCTVGDFRSNANVYVPSGYVSASGTVYAGGDVSANGRLYCGGGGGANWYDNGGYMWTDQTIRSFGILPTADNNSSSGLSGTAWAQVATYWLNNVSDATLKQRVERQAAGALSLVEKLQPVTFHWRTESQDMPLHHGFLAQEVREVMGEKFGGWREENGVQGIAYHELTAVLWGAVAELARKVNKLEEP